MLPDLTILIALVAGLWYLRGGPVDPIHALGGTLASVLVGVALTWMAGERGARAVRANELPRAVAAAQQVGLWPLAAWFGALYLFDWGTLVANEVPRTLWLARYLVLFLPCAALFGLSWVQRGRIEEALATSRGAVLPGSGARHHLRQGLKRNGVALIPLFVIMGLLEGIWLLGHAGVPGVKEMSLWLETMPILSLGVMLVVLALLTLLLPAILRKVFSTEPLPPGRTRDLLEHQAALLGLRYKDILLWKTSGHVLNAMVVGVTPGTRLIFMTDALLRRLPIEEVLAVFCHEAGHAKKRHLPLFLLLFVTTAFLFHVLGELLLQVGVHQLVVVALHLAFLWFVLLGTVSRLFEREADVYGAAHAAELFPQGEALPMPGLLRPLPAGAAFMIRALERIRQLSGRGASHRHGTIEQRVGYVAAYATDPDVRETFRATRKRFSFAVVASVVLSALVVAWSVPRELPVARGLIALQVGGDSYQAALEEREADREERARPHWKEALASFDAAAAAVAGEDGLRAAQIRMLAVWNAADTVFHGLDDEVEGRKRFLGVVKEAKQGSLPEAATREHRFQAYVDLGRIDAHRGDPQAFDAWQAARRTRPRADGEEGAWYRARLQLLRGVLLARAGVVARLLAGADPLGVLADRVRAEVGDQGRIGLRLLRLLHERTDEGVRWDEMRRDTELELKLLRETP